MPGETLASCWTVFRSFRTACTLNTVRSEHRALRTPRALNKLHRDHSVKSLHANGAQDFLHRAFCTEISQQKFLHKIF